jgi:hypothetical protein
MTTGSNVYAVSRLIVFGLFCGICVGRNGCLLNSTSHQSEQLSRKSFYVGMG